MRIIAGTARSLPLKTIEGLETRPTTDKIKETLFNMLQNDVPGCYFLDLFAGSGALALEALSRGADFAARQGLEEDVLRFLSKSSVLKPDTMIIVEASLDTDFSYLDELGFSVIKFKKYKTNMHVFIQQKRV